jgi:hypothetical protein
MPSMMRALLLACCFSLVGGLVRADKIRLENGTTIDNVQVVSEGMKEVVYKEGKSERNVPSDSVRAVEYEKRPPQLADAEELVLGEDPEGAVGTLDAFVQGAQEKPSTVAAFKWAPAAAAWRAIELRRGAGDLQGTVGAAQQFLQSFPEARFVPQAHLAKAQAEIRLGQGAQAQETLANLTALLGAKSLSKRWALEGRLLLALADDKQNSSTKRAEFEKVASEAGDFLGAKYQAQVLIGETYLDEAQANAGAAKELRAKAIETFDKVIASEQAPREAVAGAQTGRGESLFLLGADADDKARLQEAALACLRVATLFRDQGLYMPKALFYAMRSFDLLPDPRRKADMKRELLGLFPGSAWAVEAKKY